MAYMNQPYDPNYGAYGGGAVMAQPAMVMAPGAVGGNNMNMMMARQMCLMKTDSFGLECPSCQKRIMTETTCHASMQQWLMCIMLFFFAPGLNYIPFCIPFCYNYKHHCPECKYTIGGSQHM